MQIKEKVLKEAAERSLMELLKVLQKGHDQVEKDAAERRERVQKSFDPKTVGWLMR